MPTEPRKDLVKDAEFVDLNQYKKGRADLGEFAFFADVQQTQQVSLEQAVDIVARAIEVLGNRKKAVRWLKTPIPSLGDATPLSLLVTDEGIECVEDALGRIEQGIW
jgi:uncharacterized protein (DUF2384 family)